MCGKCSDYKVIVAKQEEISFFKYNLVILVLFSITCSALGLSFYAVLRVQNLSEDLNVLRLLLSKSKVKSLGDGMYKFNDHQNWGDNTEKPDDESPILRTIVEGRNKFAERSKRSLFPDSFRTTDPGSYQTDSSGDDTTTSEMPEYEEFSTEEDPSKQKIHHHIEKKAVNYEETESETFTPRYHRTRPRPRGRNNNQLEILDEFSPQAGRLKSLSAVHFSGDTSNYVYGQHSNYNGNGHLRHPQRTFVDWKESDWVDSIGLARNYPTNNGIVTIKESGLYFVYAQIYYLDEHDQNGYRVYKNSDMLLQCTVTFHSKERMMRGNTCYTAGVTYLEASDTISVGDITDGRYSLFEPGKSFFGMIKLGDAKLK